MTATCETCRFWAMARESKSHGTYGHCLRYPPVLKPDPDSAMSASGWCGEHQPRQPAEAEAPGADSGALTAERDRAMQACEQMGKRIAVLEDVLGEAIAVMEISIWPCGGKHETRCKDAIADARDALSATPPRPRIDPETRRVLWSLIEAADAALDAYGDLPSDDNGDPEYHELEDALDCARTHLVKLDGEGDHD